MRLGGTMSLAASMLLASCVVVFDTEPLDEGCAEGEKSCGGVCVSKQDPAVGCGRATCAPCVLNHVMPETCGGDGDCAVGKCEGLYSNCDDVASNGCEVNLATSNENCGRCGQNCTALFPNKPHVAATSCADQNCVVGYCQDGYADCDRSLANGCEVHVQTDAAHCGGCGKACEPGQTCVTGVCTP